MADEATPLRKSINPMTDGSGYMLPPELGYGMNFRDYGSYGLRQYSGWIREEFLPQLVGRQAVTVYREMLDNSSIVGSMVFAIQQAMRRVEWRVEAPNDKSASTAETEFVDSLRFDMSHTWEDLITEALSMLGYGFSVHEIVYKKRLGRNPKGKLPPITKFDPYGGSDFAGANFDSLPASKFEDGRIGWRRLPIRSQDTVLKWFFDPNGQIRGVTQQPWIGTLIDIPIEKLLLFRPSSHKNNPEGRSILRSSYRSWYFTKRLEEMEAILFERMAGFPVMYVPSQLMETAVNGTGQDQAKAAMTLAMYKNIVTNARVNEQMGVVLPSDVYKDADGKPSAVKMFDFQFLTPGSSGGGRGRVDINIVIARHKLDILLTTLCDFIQMGHEVRGTNNLGTVKVDMFYSAIEGWLSGITEVLNRYALPRLWDMNGLPHETMPQYRPDMPQRLDLDGLGAFIKNLADSGMALFPDEELEGYLRDAGGLPEIDEDGKSKRVPLPMMAAPDIKKMLLAAMAKNIQKRRAEGATT
jgi:hypothetical protein